jgi:uncharacterized protein
MKFQPERADGVNVITRHEPQTVWVGTAEHRGSILVPWQGEVQPWNVSDVGSLSASHFERILSLDPALVIFGSGAKLQFVKPALYRALLERGIGLETMDSAAACRTFNVLAAEGRTVVAALIVA